MLTEFALILTLFCTPFVGLIAFIIWAIVMYRLKQTKPMWFSLLLVIPVIIISALTADFIGWSLLILYCIIIWMQIPIENLYNRKIISLLTFFLLPIVVTSALIYASAFDNSVNPLPELMDHYIGDGIANRSATRFHIDVINGILPISAMLMILYFEFNMDKPKAIIIGITIISLLIGYALGNSFYMERSQFACTSISVILPIGLIALGRDRGK